MWTHYGVLPYVPMHRLVWLGAWGDHRAQLVALRLKRGADSGDATGSARSRRPKQLKPVAPRAAASTCTTAGHASDARRAALNLKP